jgi:exo-beta-1,3-glucanase (GH17 family)
MSDSSSVECGWPSAGNQKGSAIPSQENKFVAIQSVIKTLAGKFILFQAFNDYWKDPGPDGVENSFVRPSEGNG